MQEVPHPLPTAAFFGLMIEYGCPALRLGSLIHRRGERPPIRQDIESLIGSAAAATSDIGTELALFPTWERESRKHYRQTQKGWPGERQFRKSLLGYGELAAFNERIAELTKQGHQSHAMDVLKAQAISVCTENLSAGVVVVKSAKDGV